MRKRRDYWVFGAMVLASVFLYAWHPVAGGAGIAASMIWTYARGL